MRFSWLIGLWIAFFGSMMAEQNRLDIFFFYSPTCENCQFVKDTLLPGINTRYGDQLHYIWLNVDTALNYEKLSRIEHHLNRPESDYPIMVLGDTVLGSREEIEPALAAAIARNLDQKKYTIQDSVILAILQDSSLGIRSPQSADSEISIIYFTNPKCPHCSRVEKCLDYLTGKYPQIKISRFSDKVSEDLSLLEAFNQVYQVDDEFHLVTPALFIGDSFLINEQATDSRIIRIVENYQANGCGNKLEEARQL
ncbi:MAG: hypothetical protein KBA26_13635, partial [Candidatus Delongbacteria bacterium]|nr:hypothetical protein [Candidatus Delongbacteria bacterium]